MWQRGVDQRAQDVEEGTYAEGFSNRGDGFEGRVEELCMEEGHVAPFERPFELVGIVRELHAVRLDYV